jgi:hypothetical protein
MHLVVSRKVVRHPQFLLVVQAAQLGQVALQTLHHPLELPDRSGGILIWVKGG